jgi:hypothetical protein
MQHLVLGRNLSPLALSDSAVLDVIDLIARCPGCSEQAAPPVRHVYHLASVFDANGRTPEVEAMILQTRLTASPAP